MKPGWISELISVFVSVRTKSEMGDLLKGILTPGELDEIARRLQIIKRLKRGESQHAIAKALGVGVATVTRGSKEIQKGSFKIIQ